MELPYFKQQTLYTCGFACLRMILSYFGKQITEFELAKISGFNPRKGVSTQMLLFLCDVLNFRYKKLYLKSIDELREFVYNKSYPIILLKSSVYENVRDEIDHFVIVKDITEKFVIVNDPDQEFGAENKLVNKNIFERAWLTNRGVTIVIYGENL